MGAKQYWAALVGAGPSAAARVTFFLTKEGGSVKNPEGKNRKIGSIRSAQEKNEASRGSYDTIMKPQLLRSMQATISRSTHAHIVHPYGSNPVLRFWV